MVAEINWETEQVLYETLRMGLEKKIVTREAYEAILEYVKKHSGGDDHLLVPFKQLVSQYHPEWVDRQDVNKNDPKVQTFSAQLKQLTVSTRTRDEIELSEYELVHKLAEIAELKGDSPDDHIHNVGKLSALIAQEMGWKPKETQILQLAAKCHDVGKVGIADSILLKPGRLTLDEVQQLRNHTMIGAKLLSGRSQLLQVAQKVALSHHERWDGHGFPSGLSREEIPIVARIVAVADVLDSLASERPYKRAWTVAESLSEINHMSGKMFDPVIVSVCTNLFAHQNLEMRLPDILSTLFLDQSEDNAESGLDNLWFRQMFVKLYQQEIQDDPKTPLTTDPSLTQWLVRN